MPSGQVGAIAAIARYAGMERSFVAPNFISVPLQIEKRQRRGRSKKVKVGVGCLSYLRSKLQRVCWSFLIEEKSICILKDKINN